MIVSGCPGTNSAVTDWASFMVTVQAAAPVHAPDQPVKTEPGADSAVRLTVAPLANDAEQVAPQ
jgi:hypothetical protein